MEFVGIVIGIIIIITAIVLYPAQFFWNVFLFLLIPIVLIVVIGILIFLYNFITEQQPSSIKEGYVSDNDGYRFQRNIVNIFRVQSGNLPIWLIPAEWVNVERELLSQANLLFYEAKSAIKRSSFSNEIKASLLHQCSLIPQNIANGLWKLSYLRRLVYTTKGMSITKQHKLENTELQKQIIQEMESLYEKLSFLSLSLLKSEVMRDNKVIERILSELSDNNDRLQNIISSDNINFNSIEKTSNVYYVVTFVVLATTFAIISIYAPKYALPTIIIGSLLSFVAIGVFQLRNDKNLKDESFTKIIIELLKNIGLIK